MLLAVPVPDSSPVHSPALDAKGAKKLLLETKGNQKLLYGGSRRISTERERDSKSRRHSSEYTDTSGRIPTVPELFCYCVMFQGLSLNGIGLPHAGTKVDLNHLLANTFNIGRDNATERQQNRAPAAAKQVRLPSSHAHPAFPLSSAHNVRSKFALYDVASSVVDAAWNKTHHLLSYIVDMREQDDF